MVQTEHTLTCREAIARAWPKDLQSHAITVMTSENGSERVNRQSGKNFDGSIDYGCFQLNNKAHPAFFKNQSWANAQQNAAYAYQIFKSRGNFSAWYAVCTPSKVAKKPGIWCK